MAMSFLERVVFYSMMTVISVSVGFGVYGCSHRELCVNKYTGEEINGTERISMVTVSLGAGFIGGLSVFGLGAFADYVNNHSRRDEERRDGDERRS
ncbi:MAG: hypothetical protein KJ718_02070 [Nanoarchaeota archaeon]|nr:hypothetical protein [Nanoarchaeota archaeon]MBU1051321.1 hypothetical protein [Nanoarchaeota archaeon]MBU1988451.1 hypothetical protein [Nanoarchaeota archaeon]